MTEESKNPEVEKCADCDCENPTECTKEKPSQRTAEPAPEEKGTDEETPVKVGEEEKQEETKEPPKETIPPELDPELTDNPDKKRILAEIQELNVKYKGFAHKKQKLMKELNTVDEEILKCMGAYQALKKLLGETKDK